MIRDEPANDRDRTVRLDANDQRKHRLTRMDEGRPPRDDPFETPGSGKRAARAFLDGIARTEVNEGGSDGEWSPNPRDVQRERSARYRADSTRHQMATQRDGHHDDRYASVAQAPPRPTFSPTPPPATPISDFKRGRARVVGKQPGTNIERLAAQFTQRGEPRQQTMASSQYYVAGAPPPPQPTYTPPQQQGYYQPMMVNHSAAGIVFNPPKFDGTGVTRWCERCQQESANPLRSI